MSCVLSCFFWANCSVIIMVTLAWRLTHFGCLRMCSQLKTVAPGHLSVKRLDGANEAVDRAAATYVAA